MIWIGIFFVLLLAADFSLLSRKDLAFTLPLSGFTLSLLACILYFTGLFPRLRDIINLLILLFSFYTGFIFWRSEDKKQRLESILSPALIGYLILCLIALRVSNALFCQWDEFSHWGTVVKDMFFSKQPAFHPGAVSSYQTYPPAAALWELYFASYFEEWKDWPVIVACSLLMIQWMMPLFGCLKFRKEKLSAVKTLLLIPVFVIIVYLVPYLYYSPFEGIAWRCIYMDRPLALGFAWMLFMHFGTVPEKKDTFYYVTFAAGAAFQCLLKGTGIFFVLLVLLMILPDVLLRGGTEKRSILIRYGTASVFPVLTILGWYAGLRIMNVSRVWDLSAVTPGTLLRLISGQEDPRRYEVIKKFADFLKHITFRFYHGSILLTLPAYPLIWALGPALVSALNGRRDAKIDRRNLLLALMAFLELILYVTGVLVSELYVLSPEEAQQLSSAQRYSADFVLGMSCFLLFYVIAFLFSEREQRKRNFLYFLLVLVFLFNSVSVEKAWKDLRDPAREAADSYRFTNFSRYAQLEEALGEALGPDDNCYILSMDDPFGHFVLRKQLIPVRSNRESIGLDTENQCEAFVKELLFEHYEHVFVNKVSEEFRDECGGLFENWEIPDLSLFRVDYREGFELKLERSFAAAR